MVNSPLVGSVLLLIDDDLLSREVLLLLTGQEGFSVTTAESGQSALDALAVPGSLVPQVILADMQMPGIAGNELAKLLRSVCGPATTLLAMSATPCPPDALAYFDGFLLKPFSMDDLHAALALSAERSNAASVPVLNRKIYESLAEGMPQAQLLKLFNMCLDDADKRIETMRTAANARDRTAFLSGAHAIKGGCGMVGASELATLAARMEATGLPPPGDHAPLDTFLQASRRLRRMLEAPAFQP